MSQYNQRTIEYFFKKYKVANPDKKARLLGEVTDLIYDYNMLIVKYEKEGDDYRKKQLERDIKEMEDKIAAIFK